MILHPHKVGTSWETEQGLKDLQYLKDHAGKDTVAEIAKVLGRKEDTVRKKAQRQGISLRMKKVKS